MLPGRLEVDGASFPARTKGTMNPTLKWAVTLLRSAACARAPVATFATAVPPCGNFTRRSPTAGRLPARDNRHFLGVATSILPTTARSPASWTSVVSVQTRRSFVTAAGAASSAADGSSSSSCSSPPSLEDWLVSHGGEVNGVQLRSVLFPSGAVDRQLVATTDHPAGARLLTVPRLLQLRYDNIEEAAAVAAAATIAAVNAGDSPAEADDPLAIPPSDAASVAALFELMPRGSDTGAPAWPFKQALTLLYHLSRGSASPLLPYLSYLPGMAPGVPTPRVAMLMADDVVDELQSALLVQDVRNQKYWLRHVSREVLGRLLSSEPASTAAAAAEAAEAASTAAAAAAAAAAAEAAAAPGQAMGDINATAAEPGASSRLVSDGSGQGTDGRPAGSSGSSSSGGGGAFGGRVVDEQLFGWAVAVAMSRCFGLTRFRTHTCVPLVDMANHVAPYSASNCEIRSGPGGEVEMYAKSQIRAGDELTLTYGSHDNHNLLLSYGFTLQPNPNDAFFFDIDLDTIENLVEGLGDSTAPSGSTSASALAPWKRRLLADKLGLHETAAEGSLEGNAGGSSGAGSSGGGGSGASVRVYLAAANPPAAAAAATPPADGADGNDVAVGTAPAAVGPVRQPVDPKLLAALRIATLHDEAWSRVLAPMTGVQIGAWPTLLARQQEVTLMRVLAALVSALYTTFPTTIQQDRQLLASASIDVAAAAAAVTLTSPPSGAAATTPAPTGNASASSWPVRPQAHFGIVGDREAAAVADHARDMAEAIRFRLGVKTTLERCLQVLVARAKELDSLQQVR